MPRDADDFEVTRRALLVLGMHRSGTSALTGLLERLGARGPLTRLPPDDFNPMGYGESAPIRDFNDRLLQVAGTRWDAWTLIDRNWTDSPAAAGLDTEARSVLDQEFGDAHLIVVKDPRICRIVPYWLSIFAAHSIESEAVIALRSPYDVASSLMARDGIGLEDALLMWLRHVLDAERETRHMRRSFVRYTDVLDDWPSVAGRIATDLQLRWPDRLKATEVEINRFLNKTLRHHSRSGTTFEVNRVLKGWTIIAERTMDHLVQGHPVVDKATFESLDAAGREFDRATSAIGPAFYALRSELDATRTLNRDQAAGVDALRAELATVQAATQALQAELGRLQAEHAALVKHASALEQHALKLDHDLGAARRHIDELLTSGSWRLTAPLRAVWRLVRLAKPQGQR